MGLGAPPFDKLWGIRKWKDSSDALFERSDWPRVYTTAVLRWSLAKVPATDVISSAGGYPSDLASKVATLGKLVTMVIGSLFPSFCLLRPSGEEEFHRRGWGVG